MGEPHAANARTGTYGLALSGAGLRSVTDPSRRRFWIAEGGQGHHARTVQPIKEGKRPVWAHGVYELTSRVSVQV